MIRGIIRMLFRKICLEYVDDLSGVCGNFVGGRVSDSIEFWLVFGVRLEACCDFEVVVVALRDLFIY